ncbi:MAG: DUF1223 domain-containing protein [Bryobacteraceae bacterium]
MLLFLVVMLLGFPMAAAPRVPVVVELFTSEGCSSCPPADELLIRLSSQPFSAVEVIPLSLHVDYWNQLGWKDPFSSAAFSQRQQVYSRALRTEAVYTPQMIVDGRFEFVGNQPGLAAEAIQKAARDVKVIPQLEVRRDGASARVRIAVEAATDSEVILVVTEDGLASSVTRGENQGRRIQHDGVVRRWHPVGKTGGKPFSTETALAIEDAWNMSRVALVVLLQDRATRRIAGAARRPLVP